MTSSTTAAVRAIAAVSRNGVIGVHGKLPWQLPLEYSHFRRVTLGGTIVLGRKCHEVDNQGKALDGCSTVVVTSREPSAFTSDHEALGVRAAANLPTAIALAQSTWPERPVWICGGSRIYEEAFESEQLCSGLVLTRVGLDVELTGLAQENFATFPLASALARFERVEQSEELEDGGVQLLIEWRTVAGEA
jgi:dihydrofolate reductase